MPNCPYCFSRKARSIKTAKFSSYFRCSDCESSFKFEDSSFITLPEFNQITYRERKRTNLFKSATNLLQNLEETIKTGLKMERLKQFRIEQDRLWQILFFSFAVVIVALIRFRFCISLPIQTGDITRHLHYGILVNQLGLEAAGLPLNHFGEAYNRVAWAFLPYNYPAITLFFFVLITKIHSSIFLAKILLTSIEAANAIQVYILSRDRLLALIYWASPLSIWWVSGEAQFEPLQSLFLLLALCLKSSNRALSFLILALAIQVKVSAILLLPFFMIDTWISEPKRSVNCLQAFLIGFVPTLLAQLYYPSFMQVLPTLEVSPDYNPYAWNFSRAGWNPSWMVICNGVFTYGVLFLILLFALRNEHVKLFVRKQRLRIIAEISIFGIAPYIAPFLFVLACKFLKYFQFWYFTLFLSFILPIRSRFQRYCFFIFHPLLDLYGAIQVFVGPLYVNDSAYYSGISVFQKLELLTKL
jgi:hypothetical protein